MNDADLEIGLTWDRHRKALYASLRFHVEAAQTDDWDQPEEPLALDLAQLRALTYDEHAYGQRLTEMVLRPADIGRFYEQAIHGSEQEDRTLHLRLHLKAPPPFHAVRWESLRDPHTGDPIALRSRVLMSRYLSSPHWNPIPARAKHDLRALIVVAGPSNLDRYEPGGRSLAPVDVDGELERARAALAELHGTEELAHGAAGLSSILDAVERGVDVLYLVCHGALLDDVPILYLEKDNGTVDVVDGRKLVERLMALEHRPTVVMLCSCQSATDGGGLWSADDGELSALGPRLAEAGIAAVVGMQGKVSMATASTFAPAFFTALATDGVVDRAMAVARRAVADRADWWAPVLYSRLRSGRTYYRPEFTKPADVTWRTLSLQMDSNSLTPLIGPGLADAILGSRQETARMWVERWQMPLATHTQGDLAQAAQYLRVLSAPGTVRTQLLTHLSGEISRRRDSAKPGDPFWDLQLDGQSPEPAILEVARRLRQDDPGDPYRVAAALPVSVYITTAWTDLLQDALREHDPPRYPTTGSFRWHSPIDPDSDVDLGEPTAECPLVYHLFGRLDDPGSLVLTEDDYFSWFIAWLQQRKDVPSPVKRALVSKSLVFLGFRLDEWDFRVIFQSIKSFGGTAILRENQHVGVQLSPEHQLIEPEAAQEYLESYLGGDKVSIYWGDTRRFLEELRDRAGLRT